MKRTLFIFCFAFISSRLFAQYDGNSQSHMSYSIIGGGALAYFQLKSPAGTPISNGMEAVGCGGVSFDYRFNDFFSISPGLLLSGKGGQTEGLYGSFNQDISNEYQLYYLEGSLNFIGHILIGDRANIFFGAGPFLSTGIFGTNKSFRGGSPDNQSIKFGNTGDFKSNDFGITSLLGFETERGYTISLSFDLGLTNIHQSNPANGDYDQLKSRSFYIALGRKF